MGNGRVNDEVKWTCPFLQNCRQGGRTLLFPEIRTKDTPETVESNTTALGNRDTGGPTKTSPKSCLLLFTKISPVLLLSEPCADADIPDKWADIRNNICIDDKILYKCGQRISLRMFEIAEFADLSYFEVSSAAIHTASVVATDEVSKDGCENFHSTDIRDLARWSQLEIELRHIATSFTLLGIECSLWEEILHCTSERRFYTAPLRGDSTLHLWEEILHCRTSVSEQTQLTQSSKTGIFYLNGSFLKYTRKLQIKHLILLLTR
jgi:hypothetical protein